MTRAYLRLDPELFDRKAVDERYSPGTFSAFVAILCLAETQPNRGRFRSERLLRLLLDDPTDGVHLGWGKQVAALIANGDLIRQPDGSLYVEGWDEWQEGDVTVKERMARLRARKGDGGNRNPVTPLVTVPTVYTEKTTSAGPSEPLAVSRRPSAVSDSNPPAPNGNGLPHVDSATAAVGEGITGHTFLSAGTAQMTELDRLVEDHGAEAVRASMLRVADGRRRSWRQLVWDAVKDLEPFAGPAQRQTPEQRRDAEKAAFLAKHQGATS